MSNQQVKVYIRKGHGTYYVRNDRVRFIAARKGAHWIDAAHSNHELEIKALAGNAIGPIIVNNFQEKES